MTDRVRARARAILGSAAGPALIVIAVLVVLRDFAFGGVVSNQHPDVLTFFLPNYCFLGKSLAAGHVPAWNPFVMGGVPFASDPQSGWMYLPPMLLFTVLSCGTAIRWMIVLQPLLGGLGLYAFLRSEGLSRPAATTGGLVLALGVAGSRLVLFLPFPSALGWTAVLLWCASRFLRATRRSSVLLWALAAAAAWGQLAGAYLSHGAVVGTGAVAAYVLARAAGAGRDGGRDAGGRPGRRALLIRAAWLAPAMVLVNLAVLAPRFAGIAETSYATGFSGLVQVSGLLPIRWPLVFSMSPGGYLGATALALSLAGWGSGRHRALVVGFGAYGLVCYLLSIRPIGVPVASVLRHVPVLSFYGHYPGRLGIGLVVAIPVLAAVGVHAWGQGGPPRRRAAMVVPGVAIWVILPPLFATGAAHVLLLGAGVLVGGAAMAAGARWAGAMAVVPVVVAIELVAGGLLGHAGVATDPPAAAAFGSTATDWFAPLLPPAVPVAAYLRAGPIAQRLRAEDSGRFLSLAPDLASGRGYLDALQPPAWGLVANQRAVLFGIEDAQGYNPVQLDRYWRFVRAVDRTPIDYNAAFFTRLPPAVPRVMRVAWVVGPATRPPEAGATIVATEGSWALFRRSAAEPLVRMAFAWTIAEDTEAALRAVVGTVDETGPVILEGDPGVISGGTGPADGATAITITDRTGQSLDAGVRAPAPGVLIVRIPWARNWHAAVDGRSTPVLHADFVDMGVALPAGAHRIRLSYDDPWVGLGAVGSGLAVVLALGAAAILRRREGRASLVEEPDAVMAG